MSRTFQPSISILPDCNSITLYVWFRQWKKERDVRVRTGKELASRNSSLLPCDRRSPPSPQAWYRKWLPSARGEAPPYKPSLRPQTWWCLSQAKMAVDHWESQGGLPGAALCKLAHALLRSCVVPSERTGIPFGLLSQGKHGWALDVQSSQNIWVILKIYIDDFPHMAPSSQGVPPEFDELQRDERHSVNILVFFFGCWPWPRR